MKKNIINNSKWILWKREFKKKAIGDSRELTYELFKKGHSIDEISSERGFKIETTQGHILDLIAHGLIDVCDVVGNDVVKRVENVIDENNINSLKMIYEDLNEKIKYFNIKCVLASIAARPE